MPRHSQYRIYAIYEGEEILYIGRSIRSGKEWLWGIRSAQYPREIKTYLLSNPEKKFTIKTLASYKFKSAQLRNLQQFIKEHVPRFNIVSNITVEDDAEHS